MSLWRSVLCTLQNVEKQYLYSSQGKSGSIENSVAEPEPHHLVGAGSDNGAVTRYSSGSGPTNGIKHG
jgi:hypothetical protein